MARWWLGLVIVTVATIIILAAWQFRHPYEITASGKWVAVQKIASKLIIISVLSYLLVFFGRNFNAARHNFVVNQHRAKSLSTFQAFVADAKDEKSRDAVLLQAAKAAFSHQISGYLKKEGDYAGPSLIDLAKLIGGK